MIVRSPDPLTWLLYFAILTGIASIYYFLGRAAGCRAAKAIAGTEAEPSNRRWQFTLRELLLFMLAFGLLMALIVSNLPPRATPFFNSVLGDKVFKSACDTLGLQPVFSVRWEWPSEIGGPVSRDCCYCVTSPPASESKRVLDEMQQEIRHQLGLGLRPLPCGQRNGSSGPIAFCCLDYEQGRTNGTVRLYSIPGKGSEWTLVMLLDEYKK